MLSKMPLDEKVKVDKLKRKSKDILQKILSERVTTFLFTMFGIRWEHSMKEFIYRPHIPISPISSAPCNTMSSFLCWSVDYIRFQLTSNISFPSVWFSQMGFTTAFASTEYYSLLSGTVHISLVKITENYWKLYQDVLYEWHFHLTIHSILCFIFSAQCGRPNVGENMLIIGDTNLQSFPNGTTLTFRCVTGYTPVVSSASRTITCIEPEWTELQLQCTSNSPFRYSSLIPILIPHSISIFLSEGLCIELNKILNLFLISSLFRFCFLDNGITNV